MKKQTQKQNKNNVNMKVYYLTMCFLLSLLLASCNIGTPYPDPKTDNLYFIPNSKIKIDTSNKETKQIILKYGNRDKLIKFNDRGDISISTLNKDKSDNIEIYFMHDNLFKMKRNKTNSFDHDQFYYIDSTSSSACIIGSKSHGVVLNVFDDTLQSANTEFKFSLFNIGNRDDNVRYEVVFKTQDSVSILNTKQIGKYGVELKAKLNKTGKNNISGFLYEYHKIKNGNSSENAFLLNPFSFSIYVK